MIRARRSHQRGVGNLAAGGAFFGSAAANTIGFSAGFVAGAAAGATGGFLSTAANTWYNGGSFLDGIGRGIGGAVIGGYIGGAIGGVDAAIRNARIDKQLNSVNSNISTNSDGSLTPSTETLEQFSDDYFPDFKFRDKTRLLYDNDFILTLKKGTRANTSKVLKGGKYDVRFGDLAFASKKQLFLTMGHEYVHVSHLSLGLDLGSKYFNKSEYGGYFYEAKVSNENWNGNQTMKGFLGYRPYQKLPNSVYYSLSKYRQYSSWGIPTNFPKF